MSSSASLSATFKAGVLNAPEAWALFAEAKAQGRALPAVNVTSTSTINATLEAASKAKSPVIIQFSHGGAAFFAGKAIDNSQHQASIAGAIAGALHVHTMAQHYGVPVILHTDHAAHNLLPWIDGLLAAGAAHHAGSGRPLFTSHMLDLSEEPLADNIVTCQTYLTKMAALDMGLELELGVTGGEEDGVDNSHVDQSRLYTQPEEVAAAYNALKPISPFFTVAAAFGNVHGVYKPGNVQLKPSILNDSQKFLEAQGAGTKPVFFVFHGGSGSSRAEIREAIGYGAIKMNLDTDMQWAFWDGIRTFESKNRDYLQGQIGNPEGADKPNKKFYDPRVWLREAEKSMAARVAVACDDLNATGFMS